MSLSLRILLFTLAGLLLLPVAALAQWSGTGPVYTNDDVGIKTSTPLEHLHLNGSDEPLLFHVGGIQAVMSNLYWDGELKHVTDGQGSRLYFGDNALALQFSGSRTAGSAASIKTLMRLEESGNVGIGTTSPNSRLHVGQGALRISNPGAGNTLLYLDTERDWAFEQFKTDQYTALKLRSIGGGGNRNFIIDTDGRVGINTDTPSHKLAVNGTIRTKEVIVEEQNWPDFVFTEGYDLPTLEEVAAHVDAEGHLPDVPSAASAEANGVKVGAMQRTLLQKIEELTLYAIDQDEENARLRSQLQSERERNDRQQKQIERQQQEIETLKKQVRRLLSRGDE
jgi:hypothetical protein